MYIIVKDYKRELVEAMFSAHMASFFLYRAKFRMTRYIYFSPLNCVPMNSISPNNQSDKYISISDIGSRGIVRWRVDKYRPLKEDSVAARLFKARDVLELIDETADICSAAAGKRPCKSNPARKALVLAAGYVVRYGDKKVFLSTRLMNAGCKVGTSLHIIDNLMMGGFLRMLSGKSVFYPGGKKEHNRCSEYQAVPLYWAVCRVIARVKDRYRRHPESCFIITKDDWKDAIEGAMKRYGNVAYPLFWEGIKAGFYTVSNDPYEYMDKKSQEPSGSRDTIIPLYMGHKRNMCGNFPEIRHSIGMCRSKAGASYDAHNRFQGTFVDWDSLATRLYHDAPNARRRAARIAKIISLHTKAELDAIGLKDRIGLFCSNPKGCSIPLNVSADDVISVVEEMAHVNEFRQECREYETRAGLPAQWRLNSEIRVKFDKNGAISGISMRPTAEMCRTYNEEHEDDPERMARAKEAGLRIRTKECAELFGTKWTYLEDRHYDFSNSIHKLIIFLQTGKYVSGDIYDQLTCSLFNIPIPLKVERKDDKIFLQCRNEIKIACMRCVFGRFARYCWEHPDSKPANSKVRGTSFTYRQFQDEMKRLGMLCFGEDTSIFYLEGWVYTRIRKYAFEEYSQISGAVYDSIYGLDIPESDMLRLYRRAATEIGQIWSGFGGWTRIKCEGVADADIEEKDAA